MYRRFVKRILDFILAMIGLILLSPFLLVLAIVIKLDSHGPVFFKQNRVGIHKTFFLILKFRTMRIDAPKDVPTHLLENPERYISRVGRVLRKTSGDELPQLWQVLTGRMSIVGPRPALWNQFDLLEERDKYGANDIRPGLTGWAQVNGRDELPLVKKAWFDGEYARNITFYMDFKCFLLTFKNVLKQAGIAEGRIGGEPAVQEPESRELGK